MRELESFLVVDRDHFETLAGHQASEQYYSCLRQLLPEVWRLERRELWYMAFHEQVPIPEQGFKIHVSATAANAEETLRRVAPVCASAPACFKVVADAVLLNLIGSKNYGRGSSSKFFTIYPPTPETFERLIEDLRVSTSGLESAYILSDRRYKDSKVVFYRFGGFQPKHVLRADGTKEPMISAPDGTLVPDRRLPYFVVPDWVEDPFGEAQGEGPPGGVTLNGRYQVQEALAFSNSGGTYKALDTSTGNLVLIREARPFTACWFRDEVFLDASGILTSEHAVLAKLQGLRIAPEPIELFQEWEHLFLAEEFIAGMPLSSYRARDDVALLPFLGDRATALRFCQRFRTIAGNLLAAVAAVHSRNVVIGDLSPNNILLDPDTLEVRLIDFESACDLDSSQRADAFSLAWSTPGFRTPGRLERRAHLSFEDDWYAVGMTLFSMILPVQPLFELNPSARETFLACTSEAADLPDEVKTFIEMLGVDASAARRFLDDWDVEGSIERVHCKGASKGAPSARAARAARREPSERELRTTLSGIADYVLNTADPARSDRLFPTDYSVFMTNPMGLAYGACGTALFLQQATGGLPADLEGWLLGQHLDNEGYPPGLYTGLAGIAYVFWELGHRARAREVFARTYSSPLLHQEAGMLHGSAGWGLVCLYLHEQSGEQEYLRQACEIGDRLLATAESSAEGEGCSWRCAADGRVHLGFGYGASGIALFLLYLAHVSGEERFLAAARSAMEFDVAAATEIDGLPYWGAVQGTTTFEPYWLHGSGGIGSTLVRFAHLIDDQRYLDLAGKAALASYSRFSVLPCQFQGLSGIGELMLDMFVLTGDEQYRQRALDIAASVLCYRIETPKGIAFPGRYLLRRSNDLAYGSSGVGLFLKRLLDPAGRPLHDLGSLGLSAKQVHHEPDRIV